jgi:hypothetical protein
MYIAIAYAAFMVYLIYSILFSNRGKIKVRVKTQGGGEWIKWCKPRKDGKTIVIEKKTKNDPEWKATFTNKSKLSFSHWGRKFDAIDIVYRSPEAIEWNFKKNEATMPELTQADVTKYAKAKIWERRYQTDTKPIPNWILYVILLLQIGSMIFTYLLQSGRLRL